MSTRLTLFTATLVQDSALSTSGIDRETSADQPFAMVDGVPVLAGTGLKGAAVAMARRFFDPLPRSISGDPETTSAYQRSAWEFSNARPDRPDTPLRVRAGVGIRHKTGARAHRVLYDREIVPAGTRWQLTFRVDWAYAEDEAVEAEGILGYVLDRHWSAGRCWLGAGAARGLGWCHLEDLRAFRLGPEAYERWVESGRVALPQALPAVPIVEPTRSWCFRRLDVAIAVGEHRAADDQPAWGLDMLTIGTHDSQRSAQPTGNGTWARPSWAAAADHGVAEVITDRAILMHGGRPLLPGSSVRGPMRHAFSRAKTAQGQAVQDPHLVQGHVEPGDAGGRVFGSATQSSRVLVRDGLAEGEWAAARLHLHAEDEFSAGSYGSAKRDAVRVLRGTFPIRIVVEGPDTTLVEQLVAEVDRIIALGELAHLPIGGHKTRGAGWGRWKPDRWVNDDVVKARSWTPARVAPNAQPTAALSRDKSYDATWMEPNQEGAETTWVRVTTGTVDTVPLTLGAAAALARTAFGEHNLVAWWCDPANDLAVVDPPVTFRRQWPDGEDLSVDEVAFYADRGVWRAARTVAGPRWVLIEEVTSGDPGAVPAQIIVTPAELHGSSRFAAAKTITGTVCLREWHVDGAILGFTVIPAEVS